MHFQFDLFEKRHLKLKFFALLYFVLVSVFYLDGCVGTESFDNDRPNIVWIVLEDISPDAFSCYGNDYADTPHTDRLAANGILYRQAYASAPICAPARSCLITGMYATSLGTQHLRSETPRPDVVKTFPEKLREAGYFTTNHNKTDYNFDPAGIWDYWESDLVPWRQCPEGKPFFSFINFGETHEGRGNLVERYNDAVSVLPQNRLHDPDKVSIPPYYPDTPETRRLWANYYDLASAVDVHIGSVLDSLEKDGLMDNTVVFLFGDHGYGMPRYKRWLYKTGLQVPLVISVPEKYQNLFPRGAGDQTDQMVSFVDFAPTVLHLAGAEIPGNMQGIPFLGKNPPPEREYVYAARSRADDMYEMSRAILNKDFIYIRHFMPQLPYIQSGFIFSDRKESFRELRRLHLNGQLPDEAEEMWHQKPAEEFYDLRKDPDELNNAIDQETYRETIDLMRDKLHTWMIETKDLGLLPEPEYLIMAGDSSPYEYAQSQHFQVERILEAAELVGKGSDQQVLEKLEDADRGVRYWAVVAVNAMDAPAANLLSAVEALLQDPSPSVQIIAAETLCKFDRCQQALPVLEKWMGDHRLWLALQAARSTQLIGDKACPILPAVERIQAELLSKDGRRKYKDFNYASFTGWALEGVLYNCDKEVDWENQ